jgi:hypothetical protein
LLVVFIVLLDWVLVFWGCCCCCCCCKERDLELGCSLKRELWGC